MHDPVAFMTGYLPPIRHKQQRLHLDDSIFLLDPEHGLHPYASVRVPDWHPSTVSLGRYRKCIRHHILDAVFLL